MKIYSKKFVNRKYILGVFLFICTLHLSAQNHHQSVPIIMSGNEIFGAIQEVIDKLEADPSTDWSKVDLESLRQHLLDMKAFTEEVTVVSQNPYENGIEIKVQPETQRAANSLKKVFKMHPAMLKKEKGWDMTTKEEDDKWIIIVTTPKANEVEKIRALGYIGILAEGAHHQLHHWMIATGHMKMK